MNLNYLEECLLLECGAVYEKTDVSKERDASIFRIGRIRRKKQR
jgi:hypothetical protein